MLCSILVCYVCSLDLQFQWISMALAASRSAALHIHMTVLRGKKKKEGKKSQTLQGSSKETVVYRFYHWQAHQRAWKRQKEQGKTHILQQWRDQKRLFLSAAVPGISPDSWSPQIEIPASFATAYKISCWEMPKHSSLLQILPSSLWSDGKIWKMITSIARNSHESTKYCHFF